MWIRSNDTIEIVSGDDKGTRAKVLRVNRETGKLVVEGVNRVFKHVRRSQRNPQGGRLSREMPIDASNAMLVCGTCGKATRVKVAYAADGSKERFCQKCGAGNGQVAPAKSAYAKK
jgi:large subunit ribosomal protein L24